MGRVARGDHRLHGIAGEDRSHLHGNDPDSDPGVACNHKQSVKLGPAITSNLLQKASKSQAPGGLRVYVPNT